MAWYERKSCLVCRSLIGRLFFWNPKPRLVDEQCRPVNWRALGKSRVRTLLRSHSVVCDDCYRDRLHEVFELLARKRRLRLGYRSAIVAPGPVFAPALDRREPRRAS